MRAIKNLVPHEQLLRLLLVSRVRLVPLCPHTMSKDIVASLLKRLIRSDSMATY
jgi:hypothetical protein